MNEREQKIINILLKDTTNLEAKRIIGYLIDLHNLKNEELLKCSIVGILLRAIS